MCNFSERGDRSVPLDTPMGVGGTKIDGPGLRSRRGRRWFDPTTSPSAKGHVRLTRSPRPSHPRLTFGDDWPQRTSASRQGWVNHTSVLRKLSRSLFFLEGLDRHSRMSSDLPVGSDQSLNLVRGDEAKLGLELDLPDIFVDRHPTPVVGIKVTGTIE